MKGCSGGKPAAPDKPPEQAAAEEELLARLVACNARRAAEEAQGHVRWLRPAYQHPHGQAAVQTTVALDGTDEAAPAAGPSATGPLPWPQALREHIEHIATRIREWRALKKQLEALREQCSGGGPASSCGILHELARAPAVPGASEVACAGLGRGATRQHA